jgi:hypothetical protein
MGTRNLTMVIDHAGTKKIAQYGQWDGYPSGVGVGVLKFVSNQALMDKLIANLPKVRFIDSENIDKEFVDSYNKNAPEWSNQPDNRTPEQKHWYNTYISRDLSEDILSNIAESSDDEIILSNGEASATGDGWVEWSYVINLKENTLSVYGHIDQPPIKVYSLGKLPSKKKFLKDLGE